MTGDGAVADAGLLRISIHAARRVQVRVDQVTARVQASNNNSYYTDLVQVDRPVQGSGSVGGVPMPFAATITTCAGWNRSTPWGS